MFGGHRGEADDRPSRIPYLCDLYVSEFVASVISAFAGLPPEERDTVSATLPVRLVLERGRTEFAMVSLVRRAETDEGGLAAYPIPKGSGSVTTFGQADGFIIVDRHVDAVPIGTSVRVHLIGRGLRPADLVVIGSDCVGLNLLLERPQGEGIRVKLLNLGAWTGSQLQNAASAT